METTLWSLLLVAGLLVSGCAAPDTGDDEGISESNSGETNIGGEPTDATSEPAGEPQEMNETGPPEDAQPPEEPEPFALFDPELTYDGAYNGPLYATSEQVGESAPMDLYFEDLDRNGVNFFIGFFSIEGEPQENMLVSDEDLGYIIDAVQKHPHRIIPFFSPGFGSAETKPLLGDQLTGMYRTSLEASQKIVGDDVLRGFGEIEQYAWSILPTDPKLRSLFDLAQEHRLVVMFHPAVGQADAVEEVIESYPEMTFFIHMFPEDLDRDRSDYIDILQTHDNLLFSIDADHLMYDGETGLLYKYQDQLLETAASRFVSDFDSNYEGLLSGAVRRYKPLVDAVPDKVMWGTEMGPRYNYEPEVYDRLIRFSRLFIGELREEDQEKIAYQNALAVFGQGIVLEKNREIIDRSDWATCTDEQLEECASACVSGGPEGSAEYDECLVPCLGNLECIDPSDDDA